MHIIFALMAFAGAEPATAQATAAPQAAASKKEEKVCLTKTEPGSRFKSRACYSKAEYEQRQAEERRTLERMQRIGARSN